MIRQADPAATISSHPPPSPTGGAPARAVRTQAVLGLRWAIGLLARPNGQKGLNQGVNMY
jgi:hypothetical protein